MLENKQDAGSVVLKYNKTLQIATAHARNASAWKNAQISLDEFLERIKNNTRTPETVEQYHALPKSEQDRIKDVGGFFGGLLKKGRRTKDSVSQRSIVTLDADYADTNTVQAIQAALSDYAYTIYSTHRHTPEKPRLRLLVYPDRVVTPHEYTAVIRKIAEQVGIDQFDDSTYDINRLMYWPSCPWDGEYVYHHNDRPFISVDQVLCSYGQDNQWRDATLWPTSSRETAKFSRLLKNQENPLEKSGIVGAWCKTHSIYSVLEMLSDVYQPDGRGRYTFIEGSTSSGLVVYEDCFTFSHHGSDPTHGMLCNSFDLYRIHRYGDLDTDDSVSPSKRPSYVAMVEHAKKDKIVKERMVKDRLDDFDDIDEADSDWFRTLQVGESGIIKSVYFNVDTILTHDREFNDRMAKNEFAMRVENLRTGELWSTEDSTEIRRDLGRKYQVDFSDSNIEKAVGLRAKNNPVHPVRDYLNGLSWDGVERLDTLLMRYFGCTDTLYHREVLSLWMIAAVARVFRPGIKWDYVPVLGGQQGIGKTTFIRMLGRERWYGELNSFEPKVAMEDINGRWIVEITELGATNRNDLEQQKAFLSGQSTTTRVAYARHPVEYKRQCVFIGTTNQQEYLKDSTGNRRWWPIDCKVTDFIDITRLESEIDQLWAEAKVRYERDGLRLLSKEARTQASAAQSAKMHSDEWLGVLEEFLAKKAAVTRYDSDYNLFDDLDSEMVERDRVCIPEIWQDCFKQGDKPLQPRDRMRINAVMGSIPGWEKHSNTLRYGKRFGVQRGWKRVIGVVDDDKDDDLPF